MVGGGHHNIILAPEERKLFGQLFQAADSEGIGVVTGELAVKFFEKSGLSPRILGEVRCFRCEVVYLVYLVRWLMSARSGVLRIPRIGDC